MTMTTTIEHEIEQLLDAHQSKQEAAQRERDEAQRQAEATAIRTLKEQLTAELGDEFCLAFPLVYVIQEKTSPVKAEAGFEESGLVWRIQRVDLRGVGPCWNAKAAAPNSYPRVERYTDLGDDHIRDGKLRECLLLNIGMQRAGVRRAEAEAAVKAEKAKRELEERQAKQQREREQEQAKREAEAVEDARCRAKIEAAKVQAREQAWHWPAGVAVDIYLVTYTVGLVRDADGDTYLEQRSGWAAVDTFDENGYILLQPENPEVSWNYREARMTKLSMEHHKPIFERHSIRGIAELPRSLAEPLKVSVPGIFWQSYDRARYYEDADHSETFILGDELPLQWVRDLADAKR